MLLISEQHSGSACKHVRIFEPALRLGRECGLRVVSLERLDARPRDQARLLSEAKVVFLHLLDLNEASADRMRQVIRSARAFGVRVVIDTDDDYFAPADYGPFDAELERHVPIMRELIPLADTVSVTGPVLRQTLIGPCRDVRILPNWVDSEAARPRAGRAERLRIGFCGGPTHLRDLALVLPAIARLQARRDFDFVLFGLFDRDIHQSVSRAQQLDRKQAAHPKVEAFATFARSLSGVRYAHHPGVPYPQFLDRLRELDLDIGLCPVLDTHFNCCRSAIKYYQYAAVGTMTVASDVGPYRGECTALCDNTVDAWERTLATLIDDAELRLEHLRQQRVFWQAQRSWSAASAGYRATLLSAATDTVGLSHG